MFEIFLKIKHWQLFSLISILTLITESILLMNDLNFQYSNFDDEIRFEIFIIIPLVLFYSYSIITIIYAIGGILVNRISKKIRPSNYLFKISVSLLAILIFNQFFGILNLPLTDNFLMNSILSLIHFIYSIIFPFALFIIFYLFYFCAKVLKTLEKKSEVEFQEFFGYFLLFFFFPIGLWLLQAKINQLNALVTHEDCFN